MSLAKNFYGRAFIKIYYALSPTAIKLFGKTKWFQHFWKKKLDRMAADNRLLPKTEKYEAVHYMLNEWDALMNIFTRGDYHLDNNLVERLNRYISLSRRNSLFFGSHTGAKRAAMFYSLACSCRLQGINFFEYIYLM